MRRTALALAVLLIAIAMRADAQDGYLTAME